MPFLLTRTFLVFFLALCCSFPKEAAAANFKHIRIGFHTPVKGTFSDEGLAAQQGYFRMLKEVEALSSFRFSFHHYDISAGWEALKKGDIDLFGPVRHMGRGGAEYGYTDIPMAQAHVSLVVKGKENIFYDDPQSIDKKIVATFKDNPYNALLDEYLKKNNISVAYVYGTSSNYHNIPADFYLVTSLNSNFSDYLSVYNFTVDNYYLAARKEHEDLVEELNHLFKRALAENGTLLQEMYTRALRSGTSRRYLTREEMSKLRDTTFTVGYTIDHQPIQFVNEDGEPDGISIEIMQLLADEYGFKVKFEGYDPDVKGDRKEYDILLASQDVIPELQRKYVSTEPYLELPLVLFIDETKLPYLGENETIRSVGIYNYVGFDYNQIREKYSHPRIIQFNSIKDAVQSYFRGELDAALFTLTGAEFITALVGSDNFRIVTTEFSLPLRMYISKNLPYDYVEIFNLLFNQVDRTRFNVITSRQTAAFTPEMSLLKFLQNNKYFLLFILCSVACIVLASIGYSGRKKRLAVLDAINHDELTGLSSFYHFTHEATKILANAKENQFIMISVDMDHFSLVTKFYGFSASKDVILAMSKALQQAFTGQGGIVTRVVAEQFIILDHFSSLNHIKNMCEKHVIPAIQSVVGEQFCLSLSVGVYVIKNPEERIHDFVDRANAARVKGKPLHKNTFYDFDEDMLKRQEKEALIVSRMEQAVKAEEFILHYQPKIDFDTLKIHGAEALVRWYPFDGSTIYPDEFIGVFESNGFIENLDMYVFEHVCQFLHKHACSVDIPVVSINLSTFTIRNGATPQKLRGLLEKYQIRPEQVELEITESAMIDDANILKEQVENLKRVGFTVSLDDFGSGVSTLNRLASINVDVVKLDKLFLDFNINEKKGSVLVENVIRLTKELDMQVVCEGVETIEQAKWLKSLQCTMAQGYYFEKPLNEEEFLQVLRDKKEYSLDASGALKAPKI